MSCRTYRTLVLHLLRWSLVGVGVSLAIIGFVTVGQVVTAAQARTTQPARVTLMTREEAAEETARATLAALEINVDRRLAELEARVAELEGRVSYLEGYLGDLSRIADLVPADYRQLVVDTAWAHDLDPRALAALGWVESRWNPAAVGAHGEIGIMQILPETGAWIAERLGVEEYDLRDPRTNVKFGAVYLKWLVQETGSLEEALARYNAGPAWETRAPLAARAYVDRVRMVMDR